MGKTIYIFLFAVESELLSAEISAEHTQILIQSNLV